MIGIDNLKLVGFVGNVPEIPSFARAVFEVDEFNVALQKIENGRIVRWDVFLKDESIIYIDLDVSRAIGDLAIVFFDTGFLELLAGDVISVSNFLKKNKDINLYLEEFYPNSFDLIQEFVSLQFHEKFNEMAVLQFCKAPSLEKKKNDEKHEFFDEKSAVEFKFKLKNSNKVKRFVGHEFNVGEYLSTTALSYSNKSVDKSLIDEAVFLLSGVSSPPDSAAGESSRIYEKCRYDPDNLWIDFSNFKNLFRRCVFDEISRLEILGSENKISDKYSAKISYGTHGNYFQRKNADAVHFISTKKHDDLRLIGFHKFRAAHPAISAVFFWIVKDHLMLDDVYEIVRKDTAEVDKLILQGISDLRDCVNGIDYERNIKYSYQENLAQYYSGHSHSHSHSHSLANDLVRVLANRNLDGGYKSIGVDIEELKSIMSHGYELSGVKAVNRFLTGNVLENESWPFSQGKDFLN